MHFQCTDCMPATPLCGSRKNTIPNRGRATYCSASPLAHQPFCVGTLFRSFFLPALVVCLFSLSLFSPTTVTSLEDVYFDPHVDHPQSHHLNNSHVNDGGSPLLYPNISRSHQPSSHSSSATNSWSLKHPVQNVRKSDNNNIDFDGSVDDIALATSSIAPVGQGGEPIYLANLLSLTSLSSRISYKIFSDGLRAAFPDSSVVHGRPIQLVSPTYGVTNLADIVDDLLNSNPKILAFLGPLGDEKLDEWLSLVGETEGLESYVAFGPYTLLPSSVNWSPNAIFIRASPYAEVYAMVEHLVSVMRLRRIGVYLDGSNEDMEHILGNALFAAHEIHPILFRCNDDGVLTTETFEAAMTQNPQIVVINTAEGDRSASFLRMWLSNPLSKGLPAYIGSLSVIMMYEITELSSLDYEMYFVTTNAFPSDTSVPYIQDFKTDMENCMNEGYTKYFSLYSELEASIYSWYAVYGWILGKAVLSALNNTAALANPKAFQNSIFNQGSLSVDDVLIFGPYGGTAAATEISDGTKMHYCNNGAHSVHVNRVTSDKSETTMEFLYHSPPKSCGMDTYTMPAYVNGIMVDYLAKNKSLFASQDKPMVNPMLGKKEERNQFFQGLVSSQKVNSNEQVVISTSVLSIGDDSDLLTYLYNNLLDVMFGQVDNITRVMSDYSDLLLVDPTTPFAHPRISNPMVIYLMPTLDQQIYILATVVKQCGFHAAVILPVENEQNDSIKDLIANASAIYDVVIDVFNSPPHPTTTPAPVGRAAGGSAFPLIYSSGDIDDDPYTNLTEKYVLWIGVTDDELISIRQYMERNPKAYVSLLFEEFCALYASIRQVFSSALPEVQKRLVTQSNLPTWTDFSDSDNEVLKAYHSFFDEEVNTTPSSLQSWYTAGVLGELFALRYNNEATSTLKMVYNEENVEYGNVSFGPFKLEEKEKSIVAHNFAANNIKVISIAHILDPAKFGISFGPFTPDMKTCNATSFGPYSQSYMIMIISIVVPSTVATCTAVVLLFYYCCCRRPQIQSAEVDTHRPLTILVCDIDNSSNLWAVHPHEMVKATETYQNIVHALAIQLRCHELKEMGDAFLIASEDPVRIIHFAVSLQRALFDHNWGTDVIDAFYIQQEKNEEKERREPSSRATKKELALAKKEDMSEGELREIISSAAYSRMWNGLRVGVGIHTGVCEMSSSEGSKSVDYHGDTVHIAARTEKCANGGQILMTQYTWDYIRESDLLSSLYADIAVSDGGWRTLRGVALPIQMYEVEAIMDRRWRRTDRDDRDDDDDDNDNDHNDNDLYHNDNDAGVAGDGEDLVEWLTPDRPRSSAASHATIHLDSSTPTTRSTADTSAMVMYVLSSLFSSLTPRRRLEQLIPVLQRWDVPTDVVDTMNEAEQAEVLMQRLVDRATETVSREAMGCPMQKQRAPPLDALYLIPTTGHNQNHNNNNNNNDKNNNNNYCSSALGTKGGETSIRPLAAQRFLSSAGTTSGRGRVSVVNPLANSFPGFDDTFASMCLLRVDELLSGTGILVHHGLGSVTTPQAVETDRLSHLAVSFRVSTTSTTEEKSLANTGKIAQNTSFVSISSETNSNQTNANVNNVNDSSSRRPRNPTNRYASRTASTMLEAVPLVELPRPPGVQGTTLQQVKPQGSTRWPLDTSSASARELYVNTPPLPLSTHPDSTGGRSSSSCCSTSSAATSLVKAMPSSSSACAFAPLSLQGAGGREERPQIDRESSRMTCMSAASSSAVVNLPSFGGGRKQPGAAGWGEKFSQRSTQVCATTTPHHLHEAHSPRNRKENPSSSSVGVNAVHHTPLSSGLQQAEEQVKAYTFSVPMNAHGRAPSPKMHVVDATPGGTAVSYQSSKESHMTLTTVMTSTKGVPVPVSAAPTVTTLPSSFSSFPSGAEREAVVDRYTSRYGAAVPRPAPAPTTMTSPTTTTTTTLRGMPVAPMPVFSPLEEISGTDHFAFGIPPSAPLYRHPDPSSDTTSPPGPPLTVVVPEDVDCPAAPPPPLRPHFPVTPLPFPLATALPSSDTKEVEGGAVRMVGRDDHVPAGQDGTARAHAQEGLGGKEEQGDPHEQSDRAASPYSPISIFTTHTATDILPSPPSTVLPTGGRGNRRHTGDASVTPSSIEVETQAYYSSTPTHICDTITSTATSQQPHAADAPDFPSPAAVRYQTTDVSSVSNISNSISEARVDGGEGEDWASMPSYQESGT